MIIAKLNDYRLKNSTTIKPNRMAAQPLEQNPFQRMTTLARHLLANADLLHTIGNIAAPPPILLTLTDLLCELSKKKKRNDKALPGMIRQIRGYLPIIANKWKAAAALNGWSDIDSKLLNNWLQELADIADEIEALNNGQPWVQQHPILTTSLLLAGLYFLGGTESGFKLVKQ